MTNNKPLVFTHRAKDEKEPILTFWFPEPMPESAVTVSRSSDDGIGWQRQCLEATGIGRYLSYRTYDLHEAVSFTSKVSEPAISLSIRWGEGISIRFLNQQPCYKANGDRHFLYWQGDVIVEQELAPGHHVQLDVFFRPRNLSHLKNFTKIAGLLEQSATCPFGDIDALFVADSDELQTMVYAVVKEINEKKTSVERFHDLCDSLLLFALGETISITPVQNKSEAAAPPNKPVSYKPRPEEQTMLDNLKNRDKSTLLAEFYELFNTVNKKQQQKEKEIELNTMVKEQAAKLWGDEKALLAGLYFGSAKYLAMYHDDKKNTSEDRLLLKKAVVKACDLSFALEKPHVVALAFYMKWKIEGQPTFQPLDSQQLKELLTTMLPHKIMQFTSDTSRRGKNLFMEQFKEATGFTSSFSDMRASTGDKPKEIVELHKKLTEHCIETVELNLSDGITRSDILREIDSAYELNDFVSLLQIEIEQLCIRHRYVKQQDEERLKWFIIALRHLEKEYDHFFVQLKTDPVYEDLQLYHTLDDSLRKFKAEIRQKLDRSRIKGFELSAELKKVVSGQNTEQTLKFAAFMLEHEGI
jgi:hypothetical protein